MRFSLIVVLWTVLLPTLTAQLSQQLYEAHPDFREPGIKDRFIKHEQLEGLIKRLRGPWQTEVLGQSIEGRNIYQVCIGSGAEKVLLWSQMHGDEPTATMAIADIFRFFGRSSDRWDELRNRLRRDLTICFIPMLNPDGAERYERRNSLGVDLNRDALRLQNPESRILKAARDKLSADWGFNLHDQSVYYAAGNNPRTAAISFLAPAYNVDKDINPNRLRAMQLIGMMTEQLNHYIPGQIARYDDTFEPRAFGDNIQKWGTSTILIESGGLAEDPEKQELRRLHFMTLLSALDAIRSREYSNYQQADYDAIPFNRSNAFHDLILREVTYEMLGKDYTIDIAFRKSGATAHITDVGDLSTFFAYDNQPLSGYRAEIGKVYPEVLTDVAALHALNPQKLLREGYTDVRLQQLPEGFSIVPQRLLSADAPLHTEVKPGRRVSLLLKKDGEIRMAVINGAIVSL